MPAKDKVCASCGENDGETSILDYQTHLMHGMLHANGCGHSMRINGREAGSRVLSGQQLIQDLGEDVQPSARQGGERRGRESEVRRGV